MRSEAVIVPARSRATRADARDFTAVPAREVTSKPFGAPNTAAIIMTHGDEGFVRTPSARRSVNVLVAMQAMHLCATQVVMLASDDLLLNVMQLLAKLRQGTGSPPPPPEPSHPRATPPSSPASRLTPAEDLDWGK